MNDDRWRHQGSEGHDDGGGWRQDGRYDREQGPIQAQERASRAGRRRIGEEDEYQDRDRPGPYPHEHAAAIGGREALSDAGHARSVRGGPGLSDGERSQEEDVGGNEVTHTGDAGAPKQGGAPGLSAEDQLTRDYDEALGDGLVPPIEPVDAAETGPARLPEEGAVGVPAESGAVPVV